MADRGNLDDPIVKGNVEDIDIAYARFLKAERKGDYASMMFQLGIIVGSIMNIYQRNIELEQ